MVYEKCFACTKNIVGKIYRLTNGTPLYDSFRRTNTTVLPFFGSHPICKTCYKKYQPTNEASSENIQTTAVPEPVAHCSRNPPPVYQGLNHQVRQPTPNANQENQFPNCSERQVQNRNHQNGNQPVPAIETTQNVLVVPYSERCCCVCGENGRLIITNQMRYQAWHFGKIFIPLNNRYCGHHLVENGRLDNQSLDMLLQRSNLRPIPNFELVEYLGKVLSMTFSANTDNEGVFTLDVLKSDEDCHCFTGLRLQYFHDFCNGFVIPGYSDERKRKAAALLLAKLRMDNSQNQLGRLFGLSQPTVSIYIDQAAQAANRDFVPRYLGYNHITRQEYMEHMNTMIRVLHNVMPNAAAAVIDGTYFEIEKSSNFLLQKASWCLPKHYNLVKVMVISAPDGYILDVFGTTASDYHHNDAAIFNTMIGTVDGFSDFFQPGDFLIVDRGFRDSVDFCEALGYHVKMPTLLGGRSQFPLEEANYNRLVTKVRWTVEAVNGRIKRVFKFFSNQISNKYLKNLPAFIRISCALLNAYFPPIYPDNPVQLEIANYMLQRCQEADIFYQTLSALGLVTSIANWRRINMTNINQFPRLSEQDLTDITAGIYQIKEAPSYTSLHVNKVYGRNEPVETFEIYHHLEYSHLLLAKMESRLVSNKTHKAFVAYVPGTDGPNGIYGYYCTCQVGMRQVGMCSHLAAVIWLLGYAYRNNAVNNPAADLAVHVMNLRV